MAIGQCRMHSPDVHDWTSDDDNNFDISRREFCPLSADKGDRGIHARAFFPAHRGVSTHFTCELLNQCLSNVDIYGFYFLNVSRNVYLIKYCFYKLPPFWFEKRICYRALNERTSKETMFSRLARIQVGRVHRNFRDRGERIPIVPPPRTVCFHRLYQPAGMRPLFLPSAGPLITRRVETASAGINIGRHCTFTVANV